MPRATPQQLQQAKRKAAKERELEAKRQAQATEQAKLDKARTEQLSSVAATLHEELDKLNKKWPAMIISELTLHQVNKLIRSAKELLKVAEDEFIDDIVEFVPAGDMPQHRDVILVISQVRAGLERFKKSHQKDWALL